MDLSTVSGSLRFVGEDRVHRDTVWRTAGKEQSTAPCWRMNNSVQFFWASVVREQCSLLRTVFSAGKMKTTRSRGLAATLHARLAPPEAEALSVTCCHILYVYVDNACQSLIDYGLVKWFCLGVGFFLFFFSGGGAIHDLNINQK